MTQFRAIQQRPPLPLKPPQQQQYQHQQEEAKSNPLPANGGASGGAPVSIAVAECNDSNSNSSNSNSNSSKAEPGPALDGTDLNERLSSSVNAAVFVPSSLSMEADANASVWSSGLLSSLPMSNWCSPAVSPAVSPASSPLRRPLSSAGPSLSPSFQSSVLQTHNEKVSGGVPGSNDVVLACVCDAAVTQHVAELMRVLQPNAQSESQRVGVLSFVESLIRKSVGAKIFPHGSFALKTYLPDSDINACAFFTHNHQKTWGQRAMKALCREELGGKSVQPQFVIRSTEFVTTTEFGKVIRAQIGDFTLELCSNQSQTLSACALLEEVDRLVDRAHLFKRTILLVKAWAIHEAGVLNSRQGLLSSYTVQSLVLFIFNAFHDRIETPLQGLTLLLQYLAAFDWDNHAFGLFGPIYLASLPRYESVTGEPTSWPRNGKPLISKALLSRYSVDPLRPQPSTASSSSMGSMTATVSASSPPPSFGDRRPTFVKQFLNIIDPRDPLHNLGELLSRKAAGHVREALRWGCQRSLALLGSWHHRSDAGSLVAQLFAGTIECYGGGGVGGGGVVGLHGRPLLEPSSGVLECDLGLLIGHIQQANKFEMPDISEHGLVSLIVDILKANDGVVTVGKMGSLMHSATNNHSLPAMLKSHYGGLKKLLRRHESIFTLASDHPHNPHVMLLPGHVDALMRLASTAGGSGLPPPALQQHQQHGHGHDANVRSLLSPVAMRPFTRSGVMSSSSSRPPSSMIDRSALPAPPKRPSSVPVLSPVPCVGSDSVWSSASTPLRGLTPNLERQATTDAWMRRPTSSTVSTSPIFKAPAWHASLSDEFFCPISFQVMTDPVIAPDGVTYERSALEALHQEQGAFSPLTGLPLDLTAVYPNLALKALLQKVRSGVIGLRQLGSESTLDASSSLGSSRW